MATPNTSIVIGYGAFGRDALRRLLATTASRGVLSWEEAEGGDDPAGRRLRDLTLIWIPDMLGLEGPGADFDESGASFEMMEDLYRHIMELRPGPRPGPDLAELLDEQARTLLRAAGRALRSDAQPLMLNVTVLAQPSAPEVIGTLAEILTPAMDRLDAFPNLRRSQEGADLLNFVEILDFNHYWDDSSQATQVREAVYLSVQQWQARIAAGKAGFKRIYLSDSHNRDGVRDARQRMDETVLFLELLLLENRAAGLESLYRRPRDLHPPLASFGIRLVESNNELLCRLAAARFSDQWLDYLAGAGEGHPAGLGDLQEVLQPFRQGSLHDLLSPQELRQYADAAFGELEEELLALPLEDSDWSAQLESICQQRCRRIRDQLFEMCGTHYGEIQQRLLAPFAERLRDAVTGALHHSSEPATLGRVIQEIEEAARQMEDSPQEPLAEEIEGRASIGSRLQRFQQRFQLFCSSQVHVNQHRSRWPLLYAMVVSAALAPFLAIALERWKSQSLHYILDALIGFFSAPPALILSLFLIAFGLVFLAVPAALSNRVRRGKQFFTDPERGRGAHQVKALLAAEGPFRGPLEQMIQRSVLDYSYSIRGLVDSELHRALERLRERRREMLWLKRQLGEFVRMHAAGSEWSDSPASNRNAVRRSLERLQELERIQQFNLPRPDRFRSTQASVHLFNRWQARFCDTFLQPLQFLDGPLSDIYRHRLTEEEQDAQGREGWIEPLVDALQRQGKFDTGFDWQASEGLTPKTKCCVMPQAWSRLQAVRNTLSDYAFADSHVYEGGEGNRAYLLRVQLAVPPGKSVKR